MATRYTVYAPLLDFPWEGGEFLGFSDVEIRRNHAVLDLRGLDECLPSYLQDDLFNADCLLVFQSGTETDPSAAEIVNLFLLALWLARPTKTQVRLRLEVNQDLDSSENGTSWIMHDLFAASSQAVEDSLTQADLEDAAAYYDEIHKIRLSRKRLYNAVWLTHAGCVASQWAVRVVCFSGALEALLTYSKGRGITERLSRVYACLVGKNSLERDRAFREFGGLYGVRSDIMHGRLHDLGDLDREACAVRFETALREVWKAILPEYVSELEGDDHQRKALFRKLQGGYEPPRMDR